eukprot:974467-Prorocentrum_minimum.AAC.1
MSSASACGGGGSSKERQCASLNWILFAVGGSQVYITVSGRGLPGRQMWGRLLGGICRADRRSDGQTDGQTVRQTVRQTDRRSDRDRETERQRERQTETERQTDRQTCQRSLNTKRRRRRVQTGRFDV